MGTLVDPPWLFISTRFFMDPSEILQDFLAAVSGVCGGLVRESATRWGRRKVPRGFPFPPDSSWILQRSLRIDLMLFLRFPVGLVRDFAARWERRWAPLCGALAFDFHWILQGFSGES